MVYILELSRKFMDSKAFRIICLTSIFILFSNTLIVLITYLNVDENNSKSSDSKFISTEPREERKEKYLISKSEWKTIVIWSKYYGKGAPWKKIFKRHHLNECEEKRCHISTERRNMDHADAVIFDGLKLMTFNDDINFLHEFWPQKRKLNQIYVFFIQDPPTFLENINFDLYKNFFNWTMTYRLDSDVVVPYGKIINKELKSKVNYLSDHELKEKKIAIWLESHCDAQSNRRNFVDQLQKFIPIEIFGRCVKRKCGSNSLIFSGGVGKDPCEKSFVNYTFFMALENSLCNDYVTEKLYRSLKLGIIPVVFGAVNYSVFAPPNSFINAFDFKSIEDLANYMKRISSNVNSYNRFLKWKEDYDIDVGFPYNSHICDLCKKLHSDYERNPKWYPCIKKWFIDEAHCYGSKFSN